MQYARAPYVITEEEDSKDKKVGKAKNLSRYLTEKCKKRGFGRSLPPLLGVKNAPPRTLKWAQKVGIFDKSRKREAEKRTKEEQ